jgi:excisionase family DNA binding protein
MTKVKYPESGSKITPEMLPYCITFDQFAEVLNVSRRTIEGYAADGKFPVVDLGHRTKRVYYKDVETFIANRHEIDELMSKYYKSLINKETVGDKFRQKPETR